MLNQTTMAEAITWACITEVSSPKPGNVNLYSDGHNMSVQQFIDSAHAIAPILSNPAYSVGESILKSVEATKKVAHCNTNLGIILLFAPLCAAMRQIDHFDALIPQLKSTLNQLTNNDADNAYQAIRLAEAGGLGQSNEQDIFSPPTVTLKQAMKLAKNRDAIALQYCNNYMQVFEIGLPHLTKSINCGESVEWACAFAYLNLLTVLPDSLICRKYSLACAMKIQDKATHTLNKLNGNKRLSQIEAEITLWDKELKQKAINPGTTADLTAATLLVYAFSQALS